MFVPRFQLSLFQHGLFDAFRVRHVCTSIFSWVHGSTTCFTSWHTMGPSLICLKIHVFIENSSSVEISVPLQFSSQACKRDSRFNSYQFSFSEAISFPSISVLPEEPKTCFSLPPSLSLNVQRDKVIIRLCHHQNFGLYLQFLYVSMFTFANCLRTWKLLLHRCPPIFTVLKGYNRVLILLFIKYSGPDPSLQLYDSFLLPFVSMYSLETLMTALIVLISLKKMWHGIALY